MKKITLAFATILTASFISFGFVGVGNNNNNDIKITICHTPPGNPANCHEITVSLSALQAHLDHGDALVCHNQIERPLYESIASSSLNTTLVIAY
jgi:hypothetical protein